MAEKKRVDVVNRGQRGSSPLASAVFVGLRALDGFFVQRAIQTLDPMPLLFGKLGLSIPLPAPSGGAPLAVASYAITPFQGIIWSMSIVSALKQITWLLFTSKEPLTITSAIQINAFNIVSNSLNTLAFSLASINPTWSENLFYVSIPMFAAGILIESVSEVQRKIFKDKPENAHKLYTSGLFGYARHINYFGYQIWRTSMAVAGGGLALGALAGSFIWNHFVNNSIPIMDEYCTSTYGEQWQEVKRKVPYAMVPGVY